MIDQVVFWISIIPLLLINLGAVATRAAFTQTSHGRLLSLKDGLEVQVNSTIQLLSLLPRLRASLNLTLVLTRFGMACLIFAFTLGRLATWGIAIIVVAVAFLLFGLEWTLERVVSQNPERYATRYEPIGRLFLALWALPIQLLMGPVKKPQNGEEQPPATTVTEDELMNLVDAGEEEGLFEQGERKMIFSIMQLSDTLAREIMVPRIDMLALDVQTAVDEAADALLRSGHSRVPVFEESVDNTLGLLYAKDLLRVWREGGQFASLRALLRPAYFVPEAKKVDELLTEMQSERFHMAIVVDEYGGVAGLLTLEDIVEEILGEIRDEFDQGEEAPYQALKDGQYLFLGRVDLDDFNEVMGSALISEEADTLGGFIYSELGRVPAVGESVRKDHLLLTVEQVSARRIRKVRAAWLPPDQKMGASEDDLERRAEAKTD